MKSLLFIAMLIVSLPAFGQQINPLEHGRNYSFSNNVFSKTDSGIIVNHYYRKCKNVINIREFIRIGVNTDTGIIQLSTQTAFKKMQLFTIHGNVSYDFFYRSRVDTPIAQQNFYQHTEKVYLNILFKEKYPLKVAFALRQSNSPYFKNFADINVHFDHLGYYTMLKKELVHKLSKSFVNRPDINTLKALIEDKKKELLQLKNWLESPATLQKIIEERERKYARQMQQDSQADKPGIIPSIRDSSIGIKSQYAAIENKLTGEKEKVENLTSTFIRIYENKKEQADSLSKQVKLLQQKSDSIKNDVEKRLVKAKEKIYKAGNEKEIKKIAAANGIDAFSTSTLESKFAAIKTFSIGRSVLNYTELTAQNITITGLNVEYNPSYYAAFAAGKIAYRFRDFLNKNTSSNGQYLVLGRIGIGQPEKRALLLTVFQGRKNTSAFAPNDTAINHINIIGYSIESIFKKDENTGISFEVAKSTKPVTGNLQSTKQIGALWKFRDKTNFGLNIKGQTIIPATHTKLSGFFRKTGENFQSFSLFSYHTNQTAWLARADQYFYKQKVNVTGMLRRNDFTNPFTDKTYKTSTVFKSILLNVRIPKYPSLNMGYYPGSQLYVVNNEKIIENAYYLVNGSLVHSYFYKGLGMNSTFLYNRYFNQATDSGFVLYKGSLYYATQTIFLKKVQLQASYSHNKQPGLKYITLETSGDYTLKQFLKVAVGIKYNKIDAGNNYWGEKIQVGADFKLLGRLQFQYEKSFLPTLHQALFPVETGRVSWSKYF